jgi:putative restriction endonuclease
VAREHFAGVQKRGDPNPWRAAADVARDAYPELREFTAPWLYPGPPAIERRTLSGISPSLHGASSRGRIDRASGGPRLPAFGSGPLHNGSMFGPERELAARRAAFAWLDQKLTSGQAELSRSELESFEFEGEQLKLIDQSRGIRNPAQFTATLSVMTGANSPYADEPLPGGLVRYAYRSGEGGDNVKLKRAAQLGVPIIYFRSIRPGAYVADYPVYVTDVPDKRVVLLAIGEEMHFFGDPLAMSPAQRRYAERLVRQRLHQPVFRAKVMHAYERSCAICSLRHPDLLDAAHIIPDAGEAGTPEVSNGMALCKIHHAAYDRNFLAVSPDYRVTVNHQLMLEVDGPMLKHGIQAMNGQRIRVPERRSDQPNREALALRFEQFLAASP